MTPHQKNVIAKGYKEAAGIVDAVMFYNRNEIEVWKKLFRVKCYLDNQAMTMFPEIYRYSR